MYFSFELKSSVLLIFVTHAIVFSVLLFGKAIQSEHKPSLWLCAFTLLSGLYISPFMLGYAGWYSQQPYRDFLFYTPFQQLFVLPPVLYFYVKTLLYPSFRFSKKDLLHFLPGFGYLLYSLLVLVTDKLLLDEHYFYADGRDKDFSPGYQFAGFIAFMIYTALSLQMYFTYKEQSYQTVSFADSILFNWVKRFLIALLLLLLLRGLFFLLNPEWDQFGKKFWYYLCFATSFYYISVSGYVNAVQAVTWLKTAFVYESDAESEISDEATKPQSTTLSDLDIGELELWKGKLEHLMIVEKAYENPTLTLVEVAQQVNMNPKRVSQIINQGFGMNFNDFVNAYRTQAVISQLQSGSHSLLTLLGIAYECGFNSKSTFNRAFKKHTQLTPREYLAQHRH